MIKITVTMKFDDTFDARHRKAWAKGLNACSELLAQEMKAGMGRHGTPGRPGGFPGIRTGALQRSIYALKASERNLQVGAGSRLRRRYPNYLQYGTRRMAARPWMTLAYNRVKRRLPGLAADTYRRNIKK